jgi:hypothetical protein
MILMVWEAHVPQDRWTMLQQAYEDEQMLRPAAIRQSSLVQDTHDPTRWSILVVWDTHEAALADDQTPAATSAARMFQAVGVTPMKTVSTVEAQMAPLNPSSTP